MRPLEIAEKATVKIMYRLKRTYPLRDILKIVLDKSVDISVWNMRFIKHKVIYL